MLHWISLGFAAAGAAVLLSPGRRASLSARIMSVTMVVAMADAMLWGLVPPVYWAAALIAMVMAHALLARVLRAVRGMGRSVVGSSSHVVESRLLALPVAPIGTIVMAALIATMSAGDATTAGHTHGGAGASGLALTVVALVSLYLGLTVIEFVRGAGWRHRAHHAAMAASAATMMLVAVG